ncbi:MAG TPA: hypothetical protein GX507_04445 [Clostridia bacterium]|nr:hypothetical protein [Clostridia bacterium]
MVYDAHEGKLEQARMSRGVGLLISMLVRYPELSRINYNPDAHTIRFSFLVDRFLPKKEFEEIYRSVRISIEAYHGLSGHNVQVFEMTVESFDDVSVIYVTRDTHSLSQEEITLVVELLRGRLGDHLMADFGGSFAEEEIVVQEELIQQMLNDLEDSAYEKNLVAFRDGGKVLVFNK